MGIHIICGRPGNGGLNYLMLRANQEAQSKKTGFLVTESALSTITSSFNINEQILLREVKMDDSYEDIAQWVKTNHLEAVFVELFDAWCTKDRSPLKTEADYATLFAFFETVAEETGATIYVRRQLRRTVEMRDNRRPILSDLFGHEKKATSITGLYRKVFYDSHLPKESIEIIDLQNGYTMEKNYTDIICQIGKKA